MVILFKVLNMRYLILIISMLLVACSSALPTVRPYKMEITQGNLVTSKMLSQLKVGMSKSQVKFILGTALIQDMFHKDRWDYYLQQMIDGKITEQRRVIIDFKDDKLINVSGDIIPNESGDIADAGSNAAQGYKFIKPDPQVIAKTPSAPIAKADESSLADKLMFWKDNKADTDKAALKKQVEAHNQSVADKETSNKSQDTTANLASTSTTAAVDNNAASKTMGKVTENNASNEKTQPASKLKLGNEAAPATAVAIPGASSVTPPLTPLPIATVSATDSNKADVTTELNKSEDAKVNLSSTENSVRAPVKEPATTASIGDKAADEPNEVVTQSTPTEKMQVEGLLLSEKLERHRDLPLNKPFIRAEPTPLGLRLTSVMTTASLAMIEKVNHDNDNRVQDINSTDEKSNEPPSFFERMLERVGF